MASITKMLGTKLIIDGYIYLRSRKHKGKVYWDCRRLRAKECTARAITADSDTEPLIVFKGPRESPHSHPPNQEECGAEVIKSGLKRKAEENPEQPPAQIIRTALQECTAGVLNELPERENLKKMMRRHRRRDLPPNPKALSELEDLPDRYRYTLSGDRFLNYDSVLNYNEGRVMVFATRRNLELLGQSNIWFLDGTFKVHSCIYGPIIIDLCPKNIFS